MKVLYIGDIMAKPGREVISKVLPELRRNLDVDLVIAQAENVSHGKSVSTHHLRQLQALGIDFFTGGNHTIERPSVHSLLGSPDEPIIAPLNQPGVKPEWGVKVVKTKQGDVQIISLLGTTFPNLNEPIENPLSAVDKVLENTKKQKFAARIVNFHGDWSSEKRIIGYYLDGRVSAVVGDHWHIQTSDAMVLPKGTAHITDVGMCGSLDSSLGVKLSSLIPRWRDKKATKNEIETEGRMQFNALLIDIDPKTGLALKVRTISQIFDAD